MILGKNFWKGYLRICFWGQESERFLNLCAHHKIQICQIEKHEAVYWGYVLISDFYRMDEVRRKTGTKIKIKGKYGIPFFFYRNKKRRVFFVGFFIISFGVTSIGLASINFFTSGTCLSYI